MAAILNALGRFVAAAFAPVAAQRRHDRGADRRWRMLDARGRRTPASGSPSPPCSAASRSWRWSGGPSAAPASCRASRWPRSTPRCGASGSLAVPAIIAGGITQINIVVGTIIASGAAARCPISTTPTGSTSCRSASSASPSASCCCPTCRRHLRAGRDAEARAQPEPSLLDLACCCRCRPPAALIVLAAADRRVLFERGAFGAADTLATAAGAGRLRRRPAGLRPDPGAAAGLLRPRGHHDADWFAGISVVVNIVAVAGAVPHRCSMSASPLATSLAAWVNAVLLGAGPRPPRPFPPRRAPSGASTALIVAAQRWAWRWLLLAAVLPLGAASSSRAGRCCAAARWRLLRCSASSASSLYFAAAASSPACSRLRHAARAALRRAAAESTRLRRAPADRAISRAVNPETHRHGHFTPRVFSGVQPSGDLHLGNYLGAIKRFVAAAGDARDCIYCVVDMHAITVLAGARGAARAATREVAAAYHRRRLDPKKHIVFNQSPGRRACRAGLDLQLRRPHRLDEPHDPVQGQGRQGPRERLARPLRLSRR